MTVALSTLRCNETRCNPRAAFSSSTAPRAKVARAGVLESAGRLVQGTRLARCAPFDSLRSPRRAAEARTLGSRCGYGTPQSKPSRSTTAGDQAGENAPALFGSRRGDGFHYTHTFPEETTSASVAVCTPEGVAADWVQLRGNAATDFRSCCRRPTDDDQPGGMFFARQCDPTKIVERYDKRNLPDTDSGRGTWTATAAQCARNTESLQSAFGALEGPRRTWNVKQYATLSPSRTAAPLLIEFAVPAKTPSPHCLRCTTELCPETAASRRRASSTMRA